MTPEHFYPGARVTREQDLNIEHLRAFAILMVICSHLTCLRPVLPMLFWSAWSGVDLFFAISGYVIASSLSRSLLMRADVPGVGERLSINASAIGSFLIKRVWRIVPPLLATFALAALLTWVYAITTWRDLAVELASAVTMTYNYVVYGGGPFRLDVLWSLSIEMQFYLLMPFFMMSFATRRGQLLAAVLAFLVVGAVIRPLHVFLLTSHSQDWLSVRFATHCRLDSLMAGVVVYVAAGDRRVSDSIRRFSSLTVRGLLFVCMAILLFIPAATSIEFSHNAGFSCLGVASAAAVLLAVAAPVKIVDLPLVSTVLGYLGRRSFSLYLVHKLTVIAFAAAFPRVSTLTHVVGDIGVEMRAVQCVGTIGLTLAVAELMYLCVERPSMQYGRALSHRWNASRVATLDCSATPLPAVQDAAIGTVRPG